MVQTRTTRYADQTAPGFMFTPAQERETESAVIPYACQEITAIFGGVAPSVAGDYVTTFPLPSGQSYEFTYTTAGGNALAVEGPLWAAAVEADPVLAALFEVSAGGATTTLIAKSSNTSIVVGDIVTVPPGGTTLTFAQSVASAASSIRMGVLYRISTATAYVQGVTDTPRAEVIAAPLATGVTVDQIRGMVAREANATQMDPGFGNSTPDQYLSGHPFPGLLRGVGAVIVDPASGPIDPTTASIYAVLAVGTHSIVGSITDTADGANTVQINSGANPFARVVAGESTPVFQSPSQRLVRIKFNRAN